MTTHAAALRKEIATEIQSFRSLRDAIARVALLATGFNILLLEQRPQPEAVPTMSLDRWWSRDHCPSDNSEQPNDSGL